MHIVLLTYGSQGDVQPFLALGAQLRQAGHTVRLAAPARFEVMATAHGLTFTGLPGDIDTLSRALAGAQGASQFHFMRALYSEVMPLARSVLHLLRAACRDADLIVHSFLLTFAGHMLAQERGIRDVSVQLFPMFTPTFHFPGLLAPAANCGPFFNYASHAVAAAIFRISQRLSYAWLRRSDPQIGPRRLIWPDLGRTVPLLCAFSPTLVPPPPDWASRCTITGAWHMPQGNYTPPERLRHFLANGAPPVYIGLGSMIPPEAPRLTGIFLEALQRTGRRGVLLQGWSNLGSVDLPPNVIAIADTPHDWLFPQLGGIVHHGGAGTTHAALRSGVPSVALPFGADQPFWAARMHKLGVGPAPLPARELTIAALAERIAALEQPGYRSRAATISARVRAEDGVGKAVALIER